MSIFLFWVEEFIKKKKKKIMEKGKEMAFGAKDCMMISINQEGPKGLSFCRSFS